jgi:ubiquinol-cytochrome c reductase cytochrome b subunit/menaquinol-cytochrome c reductase cytochrome b/c subunit
MAYLTYSGAATGSPNSVDMKPPSTLTSGQAATFRAGALVVGQSGCLACHVIGENGNNGPGPPLTNIGSKLAPAAIASTLRNPTAPMPSFKSLGQQSPQKFQNLVNFLAELK